MTSTNTFPSTSSFQPALNRLRSQETTSNMSFSQDATSPSNVELVRYFIDQNNDLLVLLKEKDRQIEALNDVIRKLQDEKTFAHDSMDETPVSSNPNSVIQNDLMNTEAAEAKNSGSLTPTDASSPSSIISNIFNNNGGHHPSNFINHNRIKNHPTFLHNYRTLFNDSVVRYIEAEVRSDSIDKGSDPDESGISYAKRYGARGDIPAQFIAKKLGGDGNARNVYPAKPNVDLSESENAQNIVYNFVKDRQDRSAKLFYGVIYDEAEDDDEDEIDCGKHFFRAKEIFFKFELYQNNKIVGTPLKGKIENILQ